MGRPKVHAGASLVSMKILKVSITVSRGGNDVDAMLLPASDRFLKLETLACKFSLECGGVIFHLHFQVVVCIVAHSIIAIISKLIKNFLGWDVSPRVGAVVMCHASCYKGLHTFLGMLDYCLKMRTCSTFSQWITTSLQRT